MGIIKTESAVVFVPRFANAVRTNNTELVEPYSNFDWRLSLEEQNTSLPYGLERLVRNRLQDARYRNLCLLATNTEYVKKLQIENPGLDLTIYINAYSAIEKGYNEALEHDLQYYRSRFEGFFNIAYNQESSLFAFYNELLLEGIERDLHQAKVYAASYFKRLGPDQKRITPEYLISEMTETFIKQYKLSRQLQSFILSSPYKKNNEDILNSQFRFYETEILTLIENCKKFRSDIDLDFDANRAKEILAQFKINFKKEQSINQNSISKKDLLQKIFTNKNKSDEIVLGNFYDQNYGIGRYLNLHLNYANEQPKVVNGKENTFLLKKNKNKQTIELTETDYQKKK